MVFELPSIDGSMRLKLDQEVKRAEDLTAELDRQQQLGLPSSPSSSIMDNLRSRSLSFNLSRSPLSEMDEDRFESLFFVVLIFLIVLIVLIFLI